MVCKVSKTAAGAAGDVIIIPSTQEDIDLARNANVFLPGKGLGNNADTLQATPTGVDVCLAFDTSTLGWPMMGSDTADENMCSVTQYSTHLGDPDDQWGFILYGDSSSTATIIGHDTTTLTGVALNSNSGSNSEGTFDILNTSGTAADWLIGGTGIASKLTIGMAGSSANAKWDAA